MYFYGSYKNRSVEKDNYKWMYILFDKKKEFKPNKIIKKGRNLGIYIHIWINIYIYIYKKEFFIL